MGRNQRRSSRRAAQPARAAQGPPRRGWRATLDSFGGPFTVGSIVLAVVVVGVLILANRPGGDGPSGEAYAPVARAQAAGRIEGDPGAPVTIVEYADYQCPICGRYDREYAPAIRAEFIETGVASFEFRNFAFLGPESIQAAEAAECAADQGFFLEYHDILFQKQSGENKGAFDEEHLGDFAREIAQAHPDRPFDTATFDSCLASGAKRELVQTQTAEGTQLGVQATPTFLINGQGIRGLPRSLDDLRQAIEAARAAAG